MDHLIKIILFISILSCTATQTFAKDYEKLYNEAEVPQIKLMHDLDPYQNEDYFKYAFAPYPLFRLATTLYFKDTTIPPGYYLLAPRTIKDKDYVFFKESGKVKFIIPVIETDIVLEDTYKGKMPVPEETRGQKTKKKIRQAFYNHFKGSQRQEPPTAYIEGSALDNSFYQLTLYYGNKRYVMYYRTSSF